RERRYCCQDLAREADDTARKERPVADERTVEDVEHIVLREDGENSRVGTGLGDVEVQDARVRHAGQQQLPVDETGKRQVREIACGTGRLLESVLPGDACADDAG